LKSLPTGVANYKEQREQMLDSLATQIEEHLDLTPFI
jgi:adenosylcobyric acid synthase